MSKKLLYILLLLITVGVGIFLYSTIYQTSHTQYAGTFDDSDWEIPNFRVMEDVDTTQIDEKIRIYFDQIMRDDRAYHQLSKTEATQRIKNICSFYDDICDRILFDHPYTVQQNYSFITMLVYLITQVDAHKASNIGYPLRETFSKIIFDNNLEDPRGMAGHRNMLINTREMRNNRELFEILTHEMGHIIDLGVIDDPHSKKDKQFKEFNKPAFGIYDWSLKFYGVSRSTEQDKHPTVKHKDIISIYGQTNTFEEFAEFFNAWVNHHVPLLAASKDDPILRQKYELFEELFGKRYIHKDLETYHTKDITQRPYDTTRRQDSVGDKIEQ